jgi:hypothetical protein
MSSENFYRRSKGGKRSNRCKFCAARAQREVRSRQEHRRTSARSSKFAPPASALVRKTSLASKVSLDEVRSERPQIHPHNLGLHQTNKGQRKTRNEMSLAKQKEQADFWFREVYE